jgi:hypothetical protein
MSRAPAYNENQFRDYPFIAVPLPIDSGASNSIYFENLPSETIVDFGCIMDTDAEFAENDYVYLHRITRVGSVFTFTFKATSTLEELTFTRDASTADEWEIEWATSTLSAIPAYDDTIDNNTQVPDCRTSGAWRGFLVTGKFDALLAMIPSGDDVTFHAGLWTIEPGRIQNIYKHYVRSVTVLNRRRVTVTAPSIPTDAVVYDACLVGDLKFKEGYNCAIRQDTAGNRLIFSGIVGAGQGQPCDEVSQSLGETSPDDGVYLTGGPRCGDILKSLNGKGGKSITITGGPGFNVLAEPENHTLYITRDLSQFTRCGSEVT